MAHKKHHCPKKAKHYKHLTVFERAIIGQKHKEGMDDARIAKLVKRDRSTIIREYTVEKLKLGWSPEQVSIRLPMDHKGQCISAEAIYQNVSLLTRTARKNEVQTKMEMDWCVVCIRRRLTGNMSLMQICDSLSTS